mmetsp:Transcript_10894/g.32646  ORF Transcript_10894/g.32646 Transcript_10894/m.32646 type:complete len:500 (+) Transcript_10894:173-1672(+)
MQQSMASLQCNAQATAVQRECRVQAHMRGGGGLPGRCLLQQPQLPLRPTLQAIVSNHRSKLHSAAVAQQSRGQLQPRNFRNNGEAADEHGNSNGSGGGTGGGRERLDGSTGATDENTQSLNGAGNGAESAPPPRSRGATSRLILQRSAEEPTGVGSDDGSDVPAPVLGGSKYQGVKTLFRYTAFTGLAGFVAWVAHPYLLDVVGYALDLNWRESSVTPFQNSFFSVLSLLFAIFSGNSMGFLYDRQRQMVQQFYTEVGALEEVMEEAAYALGDEAYSTLNQIRKYIDQEIRGPSNQLPPLEDGLALNVIRAEARRYKEQGRDTAPVMAATMRLAEAQSARQATSLQALPFVHWALLYIIAVTFVLTLLLLEAGGNFSDEGRHVLFTATSALMTFVLMVISDLSDSADGVYAATASMEQRLSYTQRMLARHQGTAVIGEQGTGLQDNNNNQYFNRRPTGPQSGEEELRRNLDGSFQNGVQKRKPTRTPRRRKQPSTPAKF